MPDLHLIKTTIPAEIRDSIEKELKRSGMDGKVSLGGIPGLPDDIYLMVEHEREDPFSAMFEREDLKTPEAAQMMASVFVEKWNQRPAAKNRDPKR